jgi:putative ABC transport system permease protein
MALIFLAIEQLRYRRLRSALLVFTITIAFFVFGLLETLNFSMRGGDAENTSVRLIITNQAGMTEPLPMAYMNQLKSIKGVRDVGYATWWGCYYQEARQSVLTFAVEPAAWLRQHPEMVVSSADAARFRSQRNGILVSEALARKFNWKIGDLIPLGSILYAPPDRSRSWQYQVAGTFISGGQNYMVTHYDYLNESRSFWRDTVGAFMVTPDSGSRTDELAARIDGHFSQSAVHTLAASDRAFQMDFFAQFGDILFLIKCAVGAAFASLLLIVSSTAALAVTQRFKDFALLQIIGFKQSRIVLLVFGEILVLLLIGSLLGLSLAAGFNATLTSAIPQYLPDIVMPSRVLVEGLALAILMSALSAALPVGLALRLRPVTIFAIE